jgi:heme exporter protein B
MILSLIKKELLLNVKNISNLSHSMLFFIISTSIFAFLSNAENEQNALANMWVCLVFAIVLAANNHLQDDFDDGTFEQIFLSGCIFEIIIATKIISSWLFNCLPLILIIPLVALILKIAPQQILNLILVATMATILISFVVSFGKALTLASNKASTLLLVLILPLLLPIIIFANIAFVGGIEGLFDAIMLLGALLVFLVPVLTFATANAVKINLLD